MQYELEVKHKNMKENRDPIHAHYIKARQEFQGMPTTVSCEYGRLAGFLVPHPDQKWYMAACEHPQRLHSMCLF